jgi:hypothetical protein
LKTNETLWKLGLKMVKQRTWQKKEVQKRSPKKSDKKNLDFYIYELICKGYNPSQILKKKDFENLTKQKIDYYIGKLKAMKLIKKTSYAIWEVIKFVDLKEFEKLKEVQNPKKSKKTEKTCWGTRASSELPITDIHALEIKIPILSGKIDDKDWKSIKLRNWIQKYTKIEELGGLTLKNNNNKSLTIQAKSRRVKGDFEFNSVDNLATQIKIYAENYFRKKHQVILDILNCEIKNQHYATEDKNCNGMLKKGEKITLDLGKKCEKIFDNDNMNAKAWADSSPFDFTAETNDKEWKREYLKMPFSIQNIVRALPLLAEYNKNLRLHISAVDSIDKSSKENLRTQQIIRESSEENIKTQKAIREMLLELKKTIK